ncbi:MAG TPA: hypothetical protein VFQ39_20565 [Longimicrobium sp.]|nr:hypothetical protein [Longimicrobium sp.]
MTAGGYDRCVFINCPFDSRYQKLFRAIVFTVLQCGYFPRCAREVEDSGEERIRKIKRIIRDCRYGIHDISRVQLDAGSGLPRFNMPLELGLFLGAQEYGTGRQKTKRSVVLDALPFRYQVFCSDIAGQDIRAHGNQVSRLIAAVRGMLTTAADEGARIPGPARVLERYEQFKVELPDLCDRLHLKPNELEFVELRSLAQSWLNRTSAPWPPAADPPGPGK